MIRDKVAGPVGHGSEPFLCHSGAVELPQGLLAGFLGNLIDEVRKLSDVIREKPAVQHRATESSTPCLEFCIIDEGDSVSHTFQESPTVSIQLHKSGDLIENVIGNNVPKIVHGGVGISPTRGANHWSVSDQELSFVLSGLGLSPKSPGLDGIEIIQSFVHGVLRKL